MEAPISERPGTTPATRSVTGPAEDGVAQHQFTGHRGAGYRPLSCQGAGLRGSSLFIIVTRSSTVLRFRPEPPGVDPAAPDPVEVAARNDQLTRQLALVKER